MMNTMLTRKCFAYKSVFVCLYSLLTGCQSIDPPQTVDAVDFNRYMGVWYEIAKFPVFFERGLVGVTAEYALEADGRIRVTNQGFKKSFSGKVSTIKGYASVPDPEDPAKLRVRFDPFPARLFPGDYWIIDLGEDYEYALVSNPSRKMLWILSRTPSMGEDQYRQILGKLTQRGFQVEKIEKMPQPAKPSKNP
jgi:apolipoprotein D and lipocalin family protein